MPAAGISSAGVVDRRAPRRPGPAGAPAKRRPCRPAPRAGARPSASASLRPAPSISNVMSATSPLRCSARMRIPFAMVVTPSDQALVREQVHEAVRHLFRRAFQHLGPSGALRLVHASRSGSGPGRPASRPRSRAWRTSWPRAPWRWARSAAASRPTGSPAPPASGRLNSPRRPPANSLVTMHARRRRGPPRHHADVGQRRAGRRGRGRSRPRGRRSPGCAAGSACPPRPQPARP